jgi:nucleotide-binding universal stress UspA family protein
MSSRETGNPIVVAVDGSESALWATRWAAEEASRRGRTLRIMHAYEWPPGYGPTFVEPESAYRAVRYAGEAVLHAASAAAREVIGGLRIETELVEGRTSRHLLAASERAAMLVLGSRGLGGFTGLLAGSVTTALAAHGHCPVAVIRDEPPSAGPAVVGVDGSPASEAAIGFAFEEAALRGCELVAVLVWTDTVFPVGPDGIQYPLIDWTPLVEEAEELLGQRLAGWAEKYPEVVVRRRVEHDRPAAALLEAAKGARLLVVGSRGRGGFTGLALGSVSQAMVHHAPCPVVIARPDRESH